MKQVLISIAAMILIASCNNGSDEVNRLTDAVVAASEGTGSYTDALRVASDVSADITDYSTDNAALIQAAIVALVNRQVDADSLDGAEAAMTLYLANHDTMTARDSAAWAEATATVQGINGHLNTPRIVDLYRRSLTGIQTLRQIKEN